jgi:hypothetical protein
MHLAVWSQLLPPAVVAISRNWYQRPRFWASLALLAGVGGDTLQLVMGQRSINNLWVGYISTAITGILVITALMEWQVTLRRRRALLVCLLLYVIVWGVATGFEDPTRFSVLALPIHSILVLLLSLWTLITNALESRDRPIMWYDWFWGCLGLALLYGGSSAMQPLLRILLADGQIQSVVQVLNFKAGIQVVAMLLITAGMLCPVQAPSGRSSSPVR